MTGTSEDTLHIVSRLLTGRLRPQDVPVASWPRVIQAAWQQGLGPMLLWGVNHCGMRPERIPLWTPLVRNARSCTFYYTLFDHARMRVSQALADAGIRHLWMKGIALAATVYPLPTLRPMGDLDVLVPVQDRERALVSVQSLGYHFVDDSRMLLGPADELTQKLSYHYQVRGGTNNLVSLELHFHLLSDMGDELLPPEQLAWFWNQTSRVDVDHASMTILKPEAQLLHLCAHAILQDGEAQTRLLQYFDLHLLVTNSDIDWRLVEEQATRLSWAYAVACALGKASHFFCTPIPEAVVDRLRAHRPDNKNVRRAVRVAKVWRAVRLRERGARWEGFMIALGRMTFSERCRLLLRVIFPPRVYMRHHYKIRRGWSVWPYYPYRWFAQGREALWAIMGRLSRRLRGREDSPLA